MEDRSGSDGRLSGGLDRAEYTERVRALFEQFDALPPFPLPDDVWRNLVRNLRIALQMYHERYCEPGLTDQQTLARSFLYCLGNSFLRHSDAASELLHQPFFMISEAFGDLADGKVPDLFKPVAKPRNRPKNQRIDDAIKGKAARTLDRLIAAGEDRKDAAGFVVQMFRSLGIRGAENLEAKTVANWRSRCREGVGAVSEVTLEHFSAPVPLEIGSSPTELRRFLTNDMRLAIVAREPHSQERPILK